jgi:hypothetical protein
MCSSQEFNFIDERYSKMARQSLIGMNTVSENRGTKRKAKIINLIRNVLVQVQQGNSRARKHDYR